MNLFLYEMKKIWNWRTLALIAAFAALVWFSILRGDVRTYETMSHYGATLGPYQREMFERYGPTLEPEELADYDIPGKIAAVEAEVDEWIANNALFTENGIKTYAAYQAFIASDTSRMSDPERERFDETTMRMDVELWMDDHWEDPQKQFTSPYVRLGMLSNLNGKYTDYERDLRYYLEREHGPLVEKAARTIIAKHNDSLAPDNLNVSGYATVVGVSVILATLLLVSPALIRDRTRGVHRLQYASATGRRILFVQWIAAAVSACLLSALCVALSAVPLLAAGMGDYADASMLATESLSIQILYEITFGQYAALLAGMIVLLSVSAACFAFLLAKFSTNLMTALVKIVPLGLAFWVLYLSTISDAFDTRNALFATVLRGRVPMPELMLCLLLAAAGIASAAIAAVRERKADAV